MTQGTTKAPTTDAGADAPRAQDSAAQLGGRRTLAGWLAPARAALAGSLAVLVAAKLAAVAVPILYKYAVDALIAPGAPIAMPGERMLALGGFALVCAWAAARLMRAGFERLQEILCARVTQRVVQHQVRDVIPRIFHLPRSFRVNVGENLRKADAMSRTIQRAIAAMEFLLRALMLHAAPFLLELALLAGALWLVLDWRYALLVAGASALYLAVAARLAAAEPHAPRRPENEENALAAEHRLKDGLADFGVVLEFGAEQWEAEAYQRQRGPAMPKRGARQFALAFLRAALWHIGFLACLAWTVRDVAQGAVSLGGLVMVHACWMQLMLPLEGRSLDVRILRRARADLRELLAVLQKTPRVAERPNAPSLMVRAGEVVFDKVSFGYPDGPSYRIDGQDFSRVCDISFAVARGQKLAIVGASGAGKSTIGRLLFRFHDVQAGRITIDGQDVRDVSRASLRAAIGIIRHRTFLLRASIYENIAWARPSASKEEVIAAAKMAGWHERILAMRNGYETILDHRVHLKNFEKRHMDIARIALRNPPILVVDDADIQDKKPEQRNAQMALRALCTGRTVITIGYRLSTITDVDHIIFLSNGEIIEQGTHESLLALDGAYAQP